MRRVLALAIFVAAAVGTTVPASALAAPKWKLNGAAVTENVNVKTASSEIQLEDTKATLGKAAAVECLFTTAGTVGTEGKGKITEVTASSCETLIACESSGITAKAVHLPWNTQLVESEKELRDKISSGGSGTPGWSIECKVLGITVKDECTGETSMDVENASKGDTLAFDNLTAAYSCTLGGTGTGLADGSDLDEASSGTLSAESTAEVLGGIQIRPSRWRIRLGGQKLVQIVNANWLTGEEVASGALSKAPATAFEIAAGAACYNRMGYTAGQRCSVTIKTLGTATDGEKEFLEISPAKEAIKRGEYIVVA